MANTTNFNWETPDDTDLVKDGALAIRTLGSAIDTSLVDLKGGTTDQVLAKNSNTDMDFKWVADASGIPATIFDAKGDLIAASAADTAARLAVGTNGQVLTANSATGTGLAWATPASGGAVLLETVNLTSGNSQSSATLSTAYDDLVIYIENPRAGASANVALRFNSDSSSIYTNANFGSRSNASPTLDGNNSADRAYFIPQMEDAASGNIASLTIPNYNSSTFIKGFTGTTNFKDSWYGTRFFTAVWASTAAITTIQFVTSGTWASGTAKIYGVNR